MKNREKYREQNSKNEEWSLRYFKCISELIPDRIFVTWNGGRTSKTACDPIKVAHWIYCELVEDEDGNSSI